MNYLPVLWERDFSGLWSQKEGGILFHLQDGFLARFPGFSYLFSNALVENEANAFVFAEYGKVVTLTFQEWDVLVLVTPMGPLEIFSKYENDEGFYTFPFGEVISEGEVKPNIKEEFSSMWENIYPQLSFGGTHVDFKIHE